MALSTEYHCFPLTLYHLAFPGDLSFQASQFPHVVYFYLPLPGSTPFTLLCQEALPQFSAIFVHPRGGVEV